MQCCLEDLGVLCDQRKEMCSPSSAIGVLVGKKWDMKNMGPGKLSFLRVQGLGSSPQHYLWVIVWLWENLFLLWDCVLSPVKGGVAWAPSSFTYFWGLNLIQILICQRMTLPQLPWLANSDVHMKGILTIVKFKFVSINVY